jgi:hypothetical protein
MPIALSSQDRSMRSVQPKAARTNYASAKRQVIEGLAKVKAPLSIHPQWLNTFDLNLILKTPHSVALLREVHPCVSAAFF